MRVEEKIKKELALLLKKELGFATWRDDGEEEERSEVRYLWREGNSIPRVREINYRLSLDFFVKI